VKVTLENVKALPDSDLRQVIAWAQNELKAKDIDIELTDAAKTLLAERGWDQALGARPLRRTIQRLVEDALAEKLLHKEYRAGEAVIVDAVDGEIVLTSTSSMVPPDVPPVELAGSTE
jgi:ATP-dependent Clp protease ATP-binding subunit ClpC